MKNLLSIANIDHLNERKLEEIWEYLKNMSEEEIEYQKYIGPEAEKFNM